MSVTLGLNPYGLAYTLGLQGAGTPRVRPGARGLEEFVEIARAIDARCLEFDWRWLVPLSDAQLARLGDECRGEGRTVLCSAWLQYRSGETLGDVFRGARAVGAELIRLHLTPILEGARAAAGSRWPEIVSHARATLLAEAPKAAALGLSLAVENHQDFGSEELLDLTDAAGPHVGIVIDTANPFAVGEDPVAFAERVAPRVRHVHVKDYRAQFTDEGFRLVRCAVGDGCVPFDDIFRVLSRAGRRLTASIEIGALEARHIRLFDPAWWQGYPPRQGRELAVALGRLSRRQFARDADIRTPWERDGSEAELVAYEREQVDRSVRYLRASLAIQRAEA